jgi:nicotinamide-nucleotide adenylyltransferase
MTAGMIHGRFQPFHVGHLEYLRAASRRCRSLLVGITSPDRSHREDADAPAGRGDAAANPFTFTERAQMVRGVLRDEALGGALVVPFPVSRPELWPDYVPPGTVHFLRVFDEWGRAKVDRLRQAGYDVVVLDAGEGERVTGTEVRRRLREGSDWRPLVPAAVASVIDALPEGRAQDLRRSA